MVLVLLLAWQTGRISPAETLPTHHKFWSGSSVESRSPSLLTHEMGIIMSTTLFSGRKQTSPPQSDPSQTLTLVKALLGLRMLPATAGPLHPLFPLPEMLFLLYYVNSYAF